MSIYHIWVEDLDESSQYQVGEVYLPDGHTPAEHMHEIARNLRAVADEFDRQGLLLPSESEEQHARPNV